MTTAQIITAVIVALITTGGTLWGQKAAGKAQQDTKRIESSGPDWKAFTEEMRETSRAQDEKISRLEREIDQLKNKIEEVKTRYWLAIQHIRALHLRDPTAPEHTPPPEEIAGDI
ncbi:hypothetical protein G7Y31_06590 [Corynebacterium lizhenjunii]|uniref:Uncharacterized protein n=1 Tax=Corynebacterium lizhenjunii TaxID=2709394 RepID=A0A7T0PB11_9CORY|nr:hypothetical protein [Corynebacterium lizhenjunii]QPK78252.1 hypothetical protein G7Y31_06590 [Corynebacterium lizhenjunii]